MDVRCEKCLTVYELDDARVGVGGLTVKCQECGNLFKVRRRPDTTELVVPQGKQASGKDLVSDPNLDAAPTVMTRNEETTAASSRARRVLGEEDAVPDEGVPEAVTDERPTMPDQPREIGWMVRSAKTGEVQRFRELTTLQQWIVERKVTREDQISRGGESWKPLGGIAELASFFHVVEQAESVARATQPGLAVRRANQMGGLDRDGLAQLPTELQHAAFGDVDDGSSTTRRAQSRRGSAGAWIALVAVASVGAAGAWLYIAQRKHAATRRADEMHAAVEQARQARLLDTDEGFRQAIAVLDPVIEASGPHATDDAEARLELAEVNVTWAGYLREDAKAIESSNATASRTMSADAQAHLERAHRVLDGASSDDPRIALARAELARADGQSGDVVERELAKARTGTSSALVAQAEGELALRDGKLDEARTKLAQAATPHAQLRLAQLAAKDGRAADEKAACDALLAASPKHERGLALCTAPQADLGATTATPDLGAKAQEAAAPTQVATQPETQKTEADKPEVPAGDYKSLVKEGDHFAEAGRYRDAQKRYERALALDPKGAQALIGLGWCDLDAERFLSAVDRFNAALAIDPDAGDAIVGLAESYRVRGRSAQAEGLYKKYLAAHPTGPRAALARKALAQLDKGESKSEKSESKGEPSTPLLDRVTVKPQDDKPKPEAPSEETPLPHLPPQEQ